MATRRPKPAQDKLDAIGIDAVCERIAAVKSLREIADNVGVSVMVLLDWLTDRHPVQYARAKIAQAERMATVIIELADTCRAGEVRTVKSTGEVEVVTKDMVDRARLQIDARKWLAGKMAPKKYGDRVGVEHSGDVGVGASDALMAILDKITKSE